MPDPAESIVVTMGTSLLGDVAGGALSSEINSLLGIGAAPDYSSYFEQLNSQLTKLAGEVSQVQQTLGQIQGQVEQVSAQIAELQTLVEDVAIQQLLTQYVSAANAIGQTYKNYFDFVNAAVAATAPADRNSAIEGLWNTLDLAPMSEVSQNLTDIQDFFSPMIPEEKGLLDYQSQTVLDSTITFSSNSGNYVQAGEDGFSIQSEGGLFACANIVSGSHSAALNAVDQMAAPVLRAFVATQLQGLVLLRLAWAGGIHEDQLDQHVSRVQTILQEIGGFYAALVPMVVAQVAQNLQQFGKYLLAPATTQQWRVEHASAIPRIFTYTDGPYPLDNTWIMWANTFDDPVGGSGLDLVQQPWSYGERPTVSVFTSAVGPFMSRWDTGRNRIVSPFDAPMPVSLAFTTAFQAID